MKKYTTTDGKTCREITPTIDGLGKYVNPDVIYPLTKEMPIGEFEGKEVWQYQLRGSREWVTCEKTDYKTFEDYSSYMFNSWDCATRIAIDPIEKPLEGEEKVENTKEFLSITCEKDWEDERVKVYNSAIEDCVKELEKTKYSDFPYHVLPFSQIRERIIEKLNSLRK